MGCSVGLTGAPATVTIYSDPPGAVTFQGTVSQVSQTVWASTDPNLDSRVVTVYVKTDGAQIVSTQASVATTEPSQETRAGISL